MNEQKSKYDFLPDIFTLYKYIYKKRFRNSVAHLLMPYWLFQALIFQPLKYVKTII